MPRLAVLSVLSAASSPCPDLKLIHYDIPYPQMEKLSQSFFEKTGKLSIKLLFFQTFGFNRGNRTVNTFLFDQLIELIAVYRY